MRPTQLCGGGQTKRKSFDFLLLVHSLLTYVTSLFYYSSSSIGYCDKST
ncbi:hypothetical protein [Globicatella sanguinis]